MTTHVSTLAAPANGHPRSARSVARFVPSEFRWERVLRRAAGLSPGFSPDGIAVNLAGGVSSGAAVAPLPLHSPVDGTLLGSLPMMDASPMDGVIRASERKAAVWARMPLAARGRRVEAYLDELQEHRELLALLLAWEIGKPVRQGLVEVDRTLDGVRWYLEKIHDMVDGRSPLGVVATIASWNYPLSVLLHSVMVQVLAGNAAVAKVPTAGGLHVLTLCFGIARRSGLPVSLVSGSGGTVGRALALHPLVSGVVFVGGRERGEPLARELNRAATPGTLEMEGVNAYGIWEFSDWAMLGQHITKGYEYAKQRCTAYARFVVQRRLLPDFLATYTDSVRALNIGHPLAVDDVPPEPPDVDFGPLISEAAARGLDARFEQAVDAGAIPVLTSDLQDSGFVVGQDRSAYLAPRALMNIPRDAELYAKEPFGPVDTIMVVDCEDELVAEMNASEGSLVATIACDEPERAHRIAPRVNAFKVGVNRLRSRGDREEPFGGAGRSWAGPIVGGPHLVDSVTSGSRTPLHAHEIGPMIN